ncbi:unnamed protein product [Pleuronectes platessa]|uniref:Uncharacterized protein n=1 Tax=Pleuronectes platessa TaxID=8262 RepID=A0A9N7UPJ7_PLEPL|nr:unnamed protein product [Pleuronectes platessa]
MENRGREGGRRRRRREAGAEDGMGNLRITEKGLKLEGDSEFLQPLYAKEIQSKPGRPLFLQSSRNVSINILGSNNQLLTQLVTGAHGFKAQGKMFEVKSTAGKLLFSADEQEVVVGAERLRVMGLAARLQQPVNSLAPGQHLHLCSFRDPAQDAPLNVGPGAESGLQMADGRNCAKLISL